MTAFHSRLRIKSCVFSSSSNSLNRQFYGIGFLKKNFRCQDSLKLQSFLFTVLSFKIFFVIILIFNRYTNWKDKNIKHILQGFFFNI